MHRTAVTGEQLSQLMRVAIDDPRAEDAFFQALLGATVYAHVPKHAPPAGRLQFVQFKRPDNGELAIPFFTDRTKAETASEGVVGIMAMGGREFLTLTRGATLLLNPNDAWFALYPSEVDALLAGQELVGGGSEDLDSYVRVLVSPPQGLVDELTILLSAHLMAIDTVEAAYVTEVHHTPEHEGPSWLIEIIAPSAQAERLAQTSAEALRPLLRRLPPLMLICHERAEALLIDNDAAIPIYIRDVRGP